METIEERARQHAQDFCECLTCCGAPYYCRCRKYKDAYENYIKIATEQERISCAEERERCIKAVRSVSCALCLNNDDPDRCRATNCITKDIIKAIEKGGNNGSKSAG